MTQGIEAKPVYTDWVILLTALILGLPLANAVGADMSDAELLKEMIPVWEKLNPPTKGQIENPKKVTARKGPILLTLEVANTTVRKENGHHSLWLRVTLTNVGKKPVKIWDDAFQWLPDLQDGGLRYEIAAENGQPVIIAGPERPIEPPRICPPLPKDPRWDRFKAPFDLKPGDSVSTPESWDYGAEEITCLGRSTQSPLPPYGELRWLRFGENRKAKIRIVYRHSVPDAWKADYPRPIAPEQLDLETPWIPLEIIQ